MSLVVIELNDFKEAKREVLIEHMNEIALSKNHEVNAFDKYLTNEEAREFILQ